MPGWMVSRIRAGCASFAAVLAGCLLSACGGVSVSGAGGNGSGGGAAAPSITTEPRSATVSAGQSATFSVTASGSAPLSYQWRRNGSDISNATAATYVIASAQPSDSGAQFAVVVSDSGGNTVSSSATLTVDAVAPTITGQPASQHILAGQSAMFSVLATGDPAPGYQWQRNGAPIAGANAASFTLSNAQLSDSGAQFTAVVSNSAGSVTSSAATLTVGPSPPVIISQPASQTIAAGQSATFSVTASGTPAPTYQWQRNGTPIAGATGSSYTLANAQLADSGAQFAVIVSNAAGSLTSSAATLTVNAVAPTITAQPASATVAAGQAATFSVTASGVPAPTYQWLRNGAAIPGATGVSYTLANAQLADSGAKFSVTVANAAGSVTSSAATLTVNAVAPTITAQPSNQTVPGGQSATFSVTASGTPAPTYQWQRNGTPIAGATGSSYTLANAQLSDSGAQFSVVVSNSAGSVTSHAATLTVTAVAPTITAQPASLTVAAGASASFSVTASGMPAPTYQWQRNGVAIAGATAATYTLATVASSDNGAQFSVVVSNSAGSVTSSIATLTVSSAGPTISAQPSNVTVTAGTAATFSVTASGTPAPTYQWQRLIAGNWAPISGATGASYTLNSPGAADDLAQFDVVVSNSGGSVTSAIAQLAVNHTLSLVAGALGGVGNIDGTGAAAAFFGPEGAAADGAGNVYVADTADHTIRRVTAAGVVSTFAGSPHQFGLQDGNGTGALFYSPRGIAVDGSGNLYVADTGNNAIRMITPAGVVTTLAGNGSAGSTDGTGVAARFNTPKGLTVNGAGTLIYVADSDNQEIRAVTSAGVVTTYAGAAGQSGSTNDPSNPLNARFSDPSDVTLDAGGNLYVADTINSVIRRISAAGAVTTLAGQVGKFGHVDGTGAGAQFDGPTAVAVDPAGATVYVADQASNTIRTVSTAAGVVTTLAGSSTTHGWTNGTGSAASFYTPTGIATDGTNVYIADTSTNLLRSIAIGTAAVTTLAGSVGGRGYQDAAVGSNARFDNAHGVASDAAGNIYVADWGNNLIRMITPAGVVSTLAGQAGVAGSSDGTGTAAQFDTPRDIALDSNGNLYVADAGNATIRKITMPGAVVSTVAGIAGTPGRVDGPYGTNTLGEPTGVATDASNNLYIADWANNSIRMLATSGTLSTVAGSTSGASGTTNGALLTARFTGPRELAVDSSGLIYVADRDDAMIRKVDLAGNLVSTLAGIANDPGYRDAASGSSAQFNWPASIAIDGSGNLYVADSNNNAIRMVTPSGAVSTVVGAPPAFGVVVGNLPGSLSAPSGVAFIGGTGGNLRLAIADSLENAVLRAALP